ncbi:FecR family protein [Prosthecomicrobium hirschii]|uniref:FecR family protein n=1 Tax=Prosthecodimorpha hirschii TaxID=665126 RepID=UPI002220EC31|nr:FecR family protein [Prosthecomicrobium hirschii]MCW1841880.1 FecR family protein [Prosthecomicrobium hirschii]
MDPSHSLSRPPLTRRDLLGAAALLAAGPGSATLVGPASAATAGRIGIVQEVVGDAFARGGSAERRLAAAADLYLQDMVWTGTEARLAMKLGLATTVRLGARSRLVIDRFIADMGGVLDLADGATLFDRPEEAPKVDVKMRSAYGVIAVRGTRFFAGPSRGVFGVFVERGAVTVAAAGVTRLLSAGEGTDIPAPGRPPSPVARWGAPRIAEAMASVL